MVHSAYVTALWQEGIEAMINIPITTVLSQRHNPATEIVWKIFNICSLVVVRIK